MLPIVSIDPPHRRSGWGRDVSHSRHVLIYCFNQKEMEKRFESGLDNDWKLSVYC